MNITLIFTFDVSLKIWKESGLLSREVLYYKKLIEQDKVSVNFLTFGDVDDKTFIKDDLINVIPVYSKIRYSKSKLIRFLKSLFIPFVFRKELQHSDLFKTNQMLGSWVGIIAKIYFKKPLIVRTGYDLLKFKKNEKKNSFIIFGAYLVTKLSLIFCNLYFVSNYEDFVRLRKNFKFNQNKLKIIPNWIKPVEKISYLNRHEDRLLMVGRLENQKNFIEFIKTIKNESIEIDIYGDGSLKDKIIEVSKSENVKVNLLGTISNEKLLDIYPKYKLFVSSSLYEGNPKTILEAMAAGCLVYLSSSTSNLSFLENNVNCVFHDSKNNVDEEIRNILFEFKNYESIALNGYEEVKEENSLEVIKNYELDLLKKL